jgi:hydrogenase maturation protease
MRRLVLGIGNRARGDDGVGRLVARLLREKLPSDITIEETEGEATAILTRLDGIDAVHVIDAARSGAAAGTTLRFDVTAAPLPETLGALSTHGFGLGEAIELARALGHLPRIAIVHVIEGVSFETGAALTPVVGDTAFALAAHLAAELATS